MHTQLTIIGRGWAKYRDLLVASRSIVYRSRRRLRQITDLRNTDKSRYFAITEFNNCFIIWSPFFWSTKYIKSLRCLLGEPIRHFHTRAQFLLRMSRILFSAALICRQLFAGHVVSSRSMKRKEKIHWMIISIKQVTSVHERPVKRVTKGNYTLFTYS